MRHLHMFLHVIIPSQSYSTFLPVPFILLVRSQLEQWMIVWVVPSSLCPRLSSQPPGNAPHTIHLINWEGKTLDIWFNNWRSEILGKIPKCWQFLYCCNWKAQKGDFEGNHVAIMGFLLSDLLGFIDQIETMTLSADLIKLKKQIEIVWTKFGSRSLCIGSYSSLITSLSDSFGSKQFLDDLATMHRFRDFCHS